MTNHLENAIIKSVTSEMTYLVVKKVRKDMDKNTQMTPVKEVYEAPRAKISKIPNDDIITYSGSSIGKWDPQSSMKKYDF